jgi:hypothetical protein
MDKREIQKIINKHCRFKLRSGKEIFGVMWKKDAEPDLYFATYAELMRAESKNDFLSGSKVNIEEVLSAEPIEG